MPIPHSPSRWMEAGAGDPRWEELDASAAQFRERCLFHRMVPSASGIVDLSYNENPLGASPAAHRAMSERLAHVHRYPNVSSPLLVRALAELLSVDPECIAVGSGATNLCALASWKPLTSEVRKGRSPVIVFSQGSLFAYRFAAHYHHSRARIVRLRADLAQDVDALTDAVDADTRIVFLASPNNPTGIEEPRAAITRLARALPPTALLIVDQAYMHFTDHFTSDSELLDLALELDNVLLLRTFSKVYGLAGQRIGYIVGNPERVRPIRTAATFSDPGGVNLLGEVGAVAALGDHAHVQNSRRFVIERRREVAGLLRARGITCTKSQANFVFANVGAGDAEVVSALLSAGYLVTPGSELGIPGWIRFSMAEKNLIHEFIDVLTGVVGTHAPSPAGAL
jgi:histidinol-phosphate aminotransferase